MRPRFPRINGRLLQQILNSLTDPILITNENLEIVYVNDAWEKLTAYNFNDVQGKNPRILQSGKTPTTVYKKMLHTITKGKTFTTDKIINKKKNGKEYNVHSDIFPILEGNKAHLYVQLQHDITAAKHLDELRKEFLSASAHELKTPITVLKLLTQAHLSRAKGLGIDTIKTSELELVDQELDRLTRLIDDMLDSSRFETGKQFMSYEEVDLSELIKKTVKKIKIYAKNHEIVIDNQIDKAIVIADPTRIEQVLLNLLSNAVKYSPGGKYITVSLRLENKNYIVSVKDDGIGISKSKQRLIFDRYYQVKARSKIGFGLGLYISKEIIKRHKGKIWVDSIVGKGSTFYFSLPIPKGANL